MKYRIVKEDWYYVEYKWLFWWFRCCDEYSDLQFGCEGAARDHIAKLSRPTTYEIIPD